MNELPAWLAEPSLQRLFALIESADGQARAVGGCVRDHCMGRPIADIDLACTLPPEATTRLAEREGWKVVPTGLAHGTVTVLLPQRAVEITTLRRDVATDGRHATIAFTDRFEEDALRRDFTMNALYMDRHGKLYDYVGGAADITARRVRFIGDAALRIREDGLRLLRFFRFLATHGAPPADEAALTACRKQRAMLGGLSGERIAQEMRKLLTAPDPGYAIAQMGILALPEPLCGARWQPSMLHGLVQREARYGFAPQPWLRLLALAAPAARLSMAQHVAARWRLSRAETGLLEFLTGAPPLADLVAVKEALRHYPRDWIAQSVLLQSLDNPALRLDALTPVLRHWEAPLFPLTAHDLLGRGMKKGKALGDTLRALEQQWVASGYSLSREALLAMLA